MDEAVTPEVLRLARIIAASGLAASAEPERTEPYRVREAAALLGIHFSTLYREIKRGNCRARRGFNGHGAIRIPADAFAEYQRTLQRDAVAASAQAVA